MCDETNSKYHHLVNSIFELFRKTRHKNSGDISTLLQSHCQTNWIFTSCAYRSLSWDTEKWCQECNDMKSHFSRNITRMFVSCFLYNSHLELQDDDYIRSEMSAGKGYMCWYVLYVLIFGDGGKPECPGKTLGAQEKSAVTKLVLI